MSSLFTRNNFIKTDQEIVKLNAAAKIVALIHQELKAMIVPGAIPTDLNAKANEIIKAHGATPAFLGYGDFPATICFSKNEVLVHGIPDSTPLKAGDIVSIDVGVKKDGYYGDAAFTMGVGQISEKHQHLLDVSKQALAVGIAAAKPNGKLSDIGRAIENYVHEQGLKITYDYVGHGIGSKLHEDPAVPNFYDPASDKIILKPNMVLCIEPMIIIDTSETFVDPLDHWTVRTKNGKFSAHDEHMVQITTEGAKILTKI